MTPILDHIAERGSAITENGARYFRSRWEFLSGLHPFDMTEVIRHWEINPVPVESFPAKFAPSDRTWFEWEETDGSRVGIALIRDGDTDGRPVFAVLTKHLGAKMDDLLIFWGFVQCVEDGSLAASAPTFSARDMERAASSSFDVEKKWADLREHIAFLLGVMSTPGTYIKTTRHAGWNEARKLVKKIGAVGAYPLRAVSEIKLVWPPPERAEDPKWHGHTGRRCQHWVRRHERRYRRKDTGEIYKVVVVPEHTRGDPALGMKQSRYRLVPASQQPVQ
ncbi:hypothetical protein M0638_25085 [Roseomonas sp. NAR14]|uniref:Uncharacterized protein n=1 Tax=Roseomonas acroporae TaxID=2937791 RepID=A0A9X2BXU1_9PROT|nr:hypothetical protein [Roseomonas acroporae]MCK8787646.1 hypothetical protein [Roseomonas acroporae]